MSSPNKRKGTAWESAIRDFANANGHKSFRPAPLGAGDVGDVHVDGLACVQAKDTSTHRFGEWLEDVEEQRQRAGLPFGVVVAKRRRHGVGEAYAVMTLENHLALLRRLDLAERLIHTTPHIRASYSRLLEE